MTLQLLTEATGFNYSQAAESAAMESNETSDKVWREIHMLGHGVGGGVQQSVADAWEHPGTVLTEFGVSAAIGAGLTVASRGGANWKLAVGLGVAAMTYSFVKDAASRLGVIKSAVDDTWRSGENMRANEQKVASVAGPFIVDFAATSLGAGVGGGLGLVGRDFYVARRSAAAATVAEDAVISRMSLAPTYDVGSTFEGASAGSAERAVASTAEISSKSAPIAGAPENFYLRGKLNADGVWEPVRDVRELPTAGKRQLLDKLRDVSGKMMQPEVAEQFVRTISNVLNGFEPLPANASQDIVIARAKELAKAIHAFTDANGMPRLKLSLPDIGDQSTLVSGKMLFDRADGYIAIKRADLLRSPGTDGAEMTTARLYHEVGHNLQAYDIFRAEADRLGVPKVGEVDSVRRADLKEELQWRLALGQENITDSYLDRMLQAWQKDTNPVTAADRTRADQLTAGFTRMVDPGPGYTVAAQQAAEANRLRQIVRDGGDNGINQAISELRSPAVQRRAFGHNVPDSVSSMTLKPAGTAGAAEAQILDRDLSQHIDLQNMFRQRKYGKYMELPELEAWILQQKALIRARRLTATAGSTS